MSIGFAPASEMIDSSSIAYGFRNGIIHTQFFLSVMCRSMSVFRRKLFTHLFKFWF
jgi:hypothetical protein